MSGAKDLAKQNDKVARRMFTQLKKTVGWDHWELIRGFYVLEQLEACMYYTKISQSILSI